MYKELNALKEMAGDIESRLNQTDIAAFESAGDSGEDDGDGAGDDTTAASESENSEQSSESEEQSGTATAGSDGDGQKGLTDFAAESSDGEDTKSESDEPDGAVAEAAGEGETVEIVVDQRELDSNIARELSTREGVETRLETLAVGDYVCSDRVVVERKTVPDFLDSLLGGDRSSFEQVKDAARYYDRPVVILEGGGLYGERNVHPNAIRGALASLAVDFGASVLRTNGEDETIELLEVLATREQETADREVSAHGEKSAKTLPEQQEYVVSSIAEVGPVTAQSLLRAFGTVEDVVTAEEEALQEADGVGEVTAERIREVVASKYSP